MVAGDRIAEIVCSEVEDGRISCKRNGLGIALPGKRHSGRTLYAKAQSEPYAREENITAAGLPAT